MNKKYLKELAQIFLSLKNESEVITFMEAILTPKELEEIPTRLQIVKMLKDGTPQREIASKLGVGVATVSRGSQELQKGHFQNIQP